MELPEIWCEWGLELQLSDDVTDARSVLAEFGFWGERGARVADFLPAGYDAYAQIPHAKGAEGPLDGTLSAEQLCRLGELLEPFTTTPDRCVYLIWDGYGFWGGRVGYSFAGDATAEERAALRLAAADRAERERTMIEDIPRVGRPGRDYYVFEGPLAATAASFHFGGPCQSPNQWWPADRAWCVATEVDGYSSYLAGSPRCVGAVLQSRDIAALEVSPQTRLS